MTRDRRCLRLKSRGIVFARRMRVGLIDSLKFPVVDYDYRYDWILENTRAHTHTQTVRKAVLRNQREDESCQT